MEFKTVFVTVGTTSFDELIGEVNTRGTVEVLKKIGCKRLIIQYGRGPEIHLDEGRDFNIKLTQFAITILN